MLLEAHQRMAALSEQIAGPPSAHAGEDRAYAQLLSHTHALSGAMQNFLGGRSSERQESHDGRRRNNPGPLPQARHFDEIQTSSSLELKLVAAATRCRDRRQELSLVMVEPNVYDIHSDPEAEAASRQARYALEFACAGLSQHKVALVPLSDQRTAAIISNCERRAAVAVAQNAIAELARLAGSETSSDLATTLSFGVATASAVPKNFDPIQMIESASRCLSAARTCGTSAVKSIEV
jgi:hypothetical protein